MAASVSAFQLSDAMRDAICNLVDNNCPLNPSEQPKFIIAAYIAVFVPWGFLALFDMISDRWKTIRAIAFQGVFQMVIAVPTVAYTVYYIEIQRRGQDYKEMCAAIVAVCLSMFHFCRTAWGLWQVFHLWMWVKRSLRQLHEHGYSLQDIEEIFYHDEHAFWPKKVVQLCEHMWQKLSKSRIAEWICNIFWKRAVIKPLASIWTKLCKSFIVHRDGNGFRARMVFEPVTNMWSKLLKWRKSPERSAKYYENERMLWKLAAKMYVNSSVVDNEFFECDVPFEFDISALHPINWFSSKKRFLRPRYFPDSCVRYILTFLAQYGREWVEDSHKASETLKEKEVKDGLIMSNFLHQARISKSTSISGNPLKRDEDKKEANRCTAWSKIMTWRAAGRSYDAHRGVQLPFGYPPRKANADECDYGHHNDVSNPGLFELSFRRYESKIKRLVDNLPPALFETDRLRYVEVIQKICAEDLENFLMFLQCTPENPTGTVKRTIVVAPVATATHRDDAEGVQEAGSRFRISNENEREDSDHGESMPSISDTSSSETLTTFDGYKPRLLNAKLGLKYNWKLSALLRGDLRKWSQNDLEEFTVRLENFSALFHLYSDYSGTHVHWDAYLRELHLDWWPSYDVRKRKGTFPRCDKQLYYWNTWNLPENTPPALGEINMKNSGKGIRFIGYVIEKVRTHLAKWTATRDECDLKSCWTARISEDCSLRFNTGGDLSALIDKFEGPEPVPYIYIPTRTTEEGGEHFLTLVCAEKVIWKCQEHLLGLIDRRMCGPADLELVLLFLLGLPALRVIRLRNAIVLRALAPEPSMSLAVFLSAEDPDNVHIEMKIFKGRLRISCNPQHYDLKRNGHIFDVIKETQVQRRFHALKPCSEFCWDEWIHIFDGCMKVLSLDFDDDDFYTWSSSEDDDDGGEDGTERYGEMGDTRSSGGSESGIGSDVVASGGSNNNGSKESGTGEGDGQDGGSEGDDATVDIVNPLTVGASHVCKCDLGKVVEIEKGRDKECVMGEGRECRDEDCKKKDEIGNLDNERKEDNDARGFDGDDVVRSDVEVHQGIDSDNSTTARSAGEDETSTESSFSEVGLHTMSHLRRCTCEYKLGCKAERQMIEGTNKYYWDWEGWKPQTPFRKYPILYEMEESESRNEASGAMDGERAGIASEEHWSDEHREGSLNVRGQEETSAELMNEGEETGMTELVIAP